MGGEGGKHEGTVVTALADIHVRDQPDPDLRRVLEDACRAADVLVLAGDLTNRGMPPEAEVLAEMLVAVCHIPVVGVLGNHDFERDRQDEVMTILCQAGVHMLDEEPWESGDVGFAGVKGFCGGFDSHALAPFGEPSIKAFVHETIDEALRLESGLSKLRTPHRLAVLHYAPVQATVEGEPLPIFPFLGSSRLAEPIDRYRVDAAIHGHAHNGTLRGQTLGGIPVYNVALPILRREQPERPYLTLEFG